MDKLVKPFVSDKFPDFIVSGHSKFKLFLEAYYEWMEQQNTGTVTSIRNYFEALPNPSGLVVNHDLNKDIDETLDLFLEFFRRDVVPIILNKEKIDQRFFIKKVRDLYLSKGSPKSYRLLFRLLFDEEISIFETKNNIIRASDGKYVSFPFSIFRVVDRSDNLDDLDFTLSKISDNGIDGDVLSGLYINKDKLKRPIIKVLLSEKYNIEIGKTYTITDLKDSNIYIKVEALPILESFNVDSKGTLNAIGDEIIFSSEIFDLKHFGEVANVSEGSIDKLFIRSRGYGYSVGDKIYFKSSNAVDGRGGVAFITGVDNIGRITSIDNREIRTATGHIGFISSSLVDVKVAIDDGGIWKKIPQVYYDLKKTILHIWPFDSDARAGTGLEVTPVSSTIGQAEKIFFQGQPYFDSENDASITLPTQVVVQNLDGIEVNNIICFQKFKANEPNLRDDSEQYKITFRIRKQLLIDSDGTYDSEVKWPSSIKLPLAVDSDTFEWQTYSYNLDSYNGLLDDSTKNIDNLINEWQSKINTFDSEKGPQFSIASHNLIRSDYIIDGGTSFESISVGETVEGLNDFYNIALPSVGSDRADDYIYNVFIEQSFEIAIDDAVDFINQLENYHFQKIQLLNSSKEVTITTENTKETSTKIIPPNAGSWNNTGYYGIVKNIRRDEGVVTLQKADGYLYPTKQDLDNLYKEELTSKYVLIRLGVYNNVDSESVNLPLTNIVAQMDQISLSYNLSGAVETFKTYDNENGFISNLGMVLQDNFYYSTYTYVISTKVPMEEWREKVKKLLHPAGTYLFANLNLQQPAVFSNASVETAYTRPRSTIFTFDTSLEHYDTNLKIDGIFADNVLYSVNSFEFVTSNDPMGRQLTPSVYFENTVLKYRYQNGDSWWDYEPLGLVADWTTQDSDGTGLIKPKIVRYTTSSRKPYINNPVVMRVSFVNIDTNSYNVYDSDAFAKAGIEKLTFNNDSEVYEQLNYSSLVDSNITKVYKTTLTKRKKELLLLQEKDLDLVLQDPESFTYVVNDITYTGFDAFDQKWNRTTNRSINTNWQIMGFASKVQNNRKTFGDRKVIYSLNNDLVGWTSANIITKSILPYFVNTTDSDNWWTWNDTYQVKINRTLDTSKNVQESFDVKTIMKKRRVS